MSAPNKPQPTAPLLAQDYSIPLPPAITIDDAETLPPKCEPCKTDILSLFAKARSENRPLYIAAPMVRYSRLPFRLLVQRHFDVHLTYTPMMIAREFRNSNHARIADFSTCEIDGPVIAQFGAPNATDLVDATGFVKDYVAGIGLNCGCPIKEQNQEGIGAVLMQRIEVVESMLQAVREKFGRTVVLDVKIRIHADLDRTVDFAKRVAAAGADIITVHARLPKQRNSVPPNLEAIRRVREAVPREVYVVANGDCFLQVDTIKIVQATGVDGVMAARGLLQNPALFAGYERTPWKAVELLWSYAMEYGSPFRNIQYLIVEMTQGLLTKQERADLRLLKHYQQMEEWLDERFILKRRGEVGFAQLEFDGYRR
ncbi:dihydrouridine synthase-domain-containing protein [Lipomyces kononenkoae]